jgi:hypothetical protein
MVVENSCKGVAAGEGDEKKSFAATWGRSRIE